MSRKQNTKYYRYRRQYLCNYYHQEEKSNHWYRIISTGLTMASPGAGFFGDRVDALVSPCALKYDHFSVPWQIALVGRY